jgi:LPXTG-site transpeptidase (sortase) family protein
MRRCSALFRIIRYFLFLVGACMLLTVGVAYLDRFASLRAERARFIAPEEKRNANPESAKGNAQPGSSSGEPLALLRIPRLHLEVPVLTGTDEVMLNRGVGWIAGTSLPGGEGNMGVAGHRDSFFRPLEEVQLGDAIEVLTLKAKHVYTVDGMRVVSPSEIDVLRPRERSSLTLVTCYPFYFIGPAPSRYVVEASLKQ